MAAGKEKRDLTGRYSTEQESPLVTIADTTLFVSGALGLQRQLLTSGVKYGLQDTATRQTMQQETGSILSL